MSNSAWGQMTRVSERKYVRVKPFVISEPNILRICSVDFEIYDSVNGEKANDLIISGHVKWDGCSNWGNHDHGYVHMCDVEEAYDIAKSLTAAYALAHDLMSEQIDAILDFERPKFEPYTEEKCNAQLERTTD